MSGMHGGCKSTEILFSVNNSLNDNEVLTMGIIVMQHPRLAMSDHTHKTLLRKR